MPTELIDINGTTGITEILSEVSARTALYPVFGLLGSYFTMFLLLARFGPKNAFITTSAIHIIIAGLLLGIGLPQFWFFVSVFVFVISIATFIWTS